MNLDTYKGNSGSPVFDASNNTLVGLLVAGEQDYVSRGNCAVSNRLPNSAAAEQVTDVGAFAPFVPRR